MKWLLTSIMLIYSTTGFVSLSAAPTNKRTLLQGCITVDTRNSQAGESQRVPEITVLFNGMQQKSNREGLFAFPLTNQSNSYKIVICKALDQNFENANTISGISLPAQHRSRVITLNCEGSEDGSLICQSETCTEKSDGTLSCQARKPDQAHSITTENSIILLIDPEHIERIEPWNVTLASNFVKLPRIVLKKKSRQDFNKVSAESILYALDVKPFHEPASGKKRTITKNTGNIKIAVLS